MILTPENIAVLDAAARAGGFEPRSADLYAEHERIAADLDNSYRAESIEHLTRWKREAETPGHVERIHEEVRARDAERAKRRDAERGSKPKGDRPSHDEKRAGSSIGYVFGGTPLVILGDPSLTANAKVAAGLIAEKLYNFPKSHNRHREISYAELAGSMGVTTRTAIRTVRQLVGEGYVELVTPGIGRRGNLYAFSPKVLTPSASS